MFLMTNIEGMRSYLDFKRIDGMFSKSMNKLSSGLRAPTPNAGSEWVVANDMEVMYHEYEVGSEHIQNGLGVLEVAQRVMMEISDIMLRMDEIIHRAASEEINNDQRREMDVEWKALRSNIVSLTAEVRYNDIPLYSNASNAKSFSLLIGRSQYIVVSTYSMGPGALMLSGYSIGSTFSIAALAIPFMKSAIVNMNMLMARMGGQVRQIEGKVRILQEQTMQQRGIRARTNELDYAKEMREYTSMQVVVQAANAMMAQANTKPQMVLQLFGQ